MVLQSPRPFWKLLRQDSCPKSHMEHSGNEQIHISSSCCNPAVQTSSLLVLLRENTKALVPFVAPHFPTSFKSLPFSIFRWRKTKRILGKWFSWAKPDHSAHNFCFHFTHQNSVMWVHLCMGVREMKFSYVPMRKRK